TWCFRCFWLRRWPPRSPSPRGLRHGCVAAGSRSDTRAEASSAPRAGLPRAVEPCRPPAGFAGAPGGHDRLEPAVRTGDGTMVIEVSDALPVGGAVARSRAACRADLGRRLAG